MSTITPEDVLLKIDVTTDRRQPLAEVGEERGRPRDGAI